MHTYRDQQGRKMPLYIFPIYIGQPYSDAFCCVRWIVVSVITFVFWFSSEVRRSSWSGRSVRVRERRRSESRGSAYRSSRNWNWLWLSVEPKCPEREASVLQRDSPKTFRWSFCPNHTLFLKISQVCCSDHWTNEVQQNQRSKLQIHFTHLLMNCTKRSTTLLCFKNIIYSFTKYCRTSWRSYKWDLFSLKSFINAQNSHNKYQPISMANVGFAKPKVLYISVSLGP